MDRTWTWKFRIWSSRYIVSISCFELSSVLGSWFGGECHVGVIALQYLCLLV